MVSRVCANGRVAQYDRRDIHRPPESSAIHVYMCTCIVQENIEHRHGVTYAQAEVYPGTDTV